MCFCNDKSIPILEIAYPPEPKINNGDRDKYCTFSCYKGLDRDPAQRMDNYLEIKEKYAKYLKEYGLYDKC